MQCAALAANGDVLTAVALYVEYRVGEDVADEVRFGLADPLNFASKPEHQPVLREALEFCWANYRSDFSPSPERWKFMWDYVGNRFVTVKLLDAAWVAVQQMEKDATRSQLLNGLSEGSGNEQSKETDFESLTDEEIARLKTATLREYAKQHRRRG